MAINQLNMCNKIRNRESQSFMKKHTLGASLVNASCP